MAEWAAGLEQGYLHFAGRLDVIVERIRSFYNETRVGVLDIIFTGGQTPPEAVKRSIELFGQEVLPRIRLLCSGCD